MFFLLFLKESNAIWEPDGHLQQKQVWFPNWLPDLNMPVFCILTCQLNSEHPSNGKKWQYQSSLW